MIQTIISPTDEYLEQWCKKFQEEFDKEAQKHPLLWYFITKYREKLNETKQP